ncbi:MAG: AraC family transcriptional regulator [Oscillospiraceae bacterium]|nr:AraC family transcriptional regulator [Oscillospiraceae bacterium]
MNYQAVVLNALERIEAELLDGICTEVLAREAFFSQYHFQRIFRKITGMSVMEYVKKRKLSLAAEEIAYGTQNILYIAFKYGYQSNEAFTRAFKAFHHVTPSETRQYRIRKSLEKFQIIADNKRADFLL